MEGNENEVQQESQQEGDYYEAKQNYWPFPVMALILVIAFLCWNFLPNAEKRVHLVSWGKSYHAVGAVIICQPFQEQSRAYNGEGSYRALIRTPQDVIFEVAFRGGSQPPGFANAIGEIAYHECGKEDGRVVHCFESFKFFHEGVKPLDVNGKPVEASQQPK